MGILALGPQRRLALPDTPPALVSPTSSSYSSRPSPPGDRPWNAGTPTSPHMSNYDRKPTVEMTSVGKNMEETQSRKDVAQPSAQRQQLPSLSSLFGPPSSVRPLQSPMSDRPSPLSATSVSMDRPRVTSAHGERAYPASPYYAQTISPPVSQPRTYDPRYDHDRPHAPALNRSFSGPGSPAHRDSDLQRQESRSDYGSTGSKWSIHQEPSRPEYGLGSRERDLPRLQQHERPPLQFGKESSFNYREPRPYTAPMQTQPPTPTSTVVSEGMPAKDGLGPKIWTGSQFLPRFVRAAEVPGEGTCYFYDDGSHCKTVIDGEAVNAHWGVTKAGKPRKRLAIACVTCREKKIKCDPDFPRCVQCEKFGRVCKFKNA
jgi:hypothetical protein